MIPSSRCRTKLTGYFKGVKHEMELLRNLILLGCTGWWWFSVPRQVGWNNHEDHERWHDCADRREVYAGKSCKLHRWRWSHGRWNCENSVFWSGGSSTGSWLLSSRRWRLKSVHGGSCKETTSRWWAYSSRWSLLDICRICVRLGYDWTWVVIEV